MANLSLYPSGLGGWRTWPVIRNLRFAGLRRLRPLKNGGPNGTSLSRYYWAQFYGTAPRRHARPRARNRHD